MTYTLEIWQEQAAEKLAQFGNWLDRRREDVPYVVYGTLCGLTLWPLVEAAAAASQSGQPMPASLFITLGSVAGGVGGNLIAEQIQRWADRAEEITEDDIAGWAADHAAENADVRDALDNILDKIDAVQQAELAISEEDRIWLMESLQRELVQLGNLDRYQATVVGSGAIAQGERAKAAGERAVIVDGDVTGPIITGDHVQIGELGTDPDALRNAYLSHLLSQTSHLSLVGIDPKAASEAEARMQLGAVYTALLTQQTDIEIRIGTREPSDQRPISALDQLNRHAKLVLLGDPGSGKSTFVNFVAACLAGEALGRDDLNMDLLTAPLPDEEGQDQEESQPWDHGPLLPVRVILRDLTARGLPEAGDRATAEDLCRFLEAELEAASLADYAPHFRGELREKGGLLLLDGLDEVPEADRRRAQIKQMVEDFVGAFPLVRVLVTSRTYAYQKQQWQLPDFHEAILAPFSQGQIHRFVDRWYAHIGQLRGLRPDDAQGRAALLIGAISRSGRLRGLAERPLLLTLMASLHAWRGGSLPEKREELYNDAVDLLLDWWESQRVVRDAQGNIELIQPSLAEWLKVDRDKVRALLNQMAFEAHSAQPELVGTADIPEEKLVGALMRLSDNPDARPGRLVEFLSHRAGLLVPRGIGVYTFPHRTFQEYLAACYLTDHDYPDKVADLVRSDPNRWREIALLAGAKAARGSASTIWSLVDALCYKETEATSELKDAWGAHLAGQALVESADLTQVSARNRPKVERVQQWLVYLIGGDQLPTVERMDAVRNLAFLGDPRLEIMTVDGMQFCYVPAGPFWMGSEEEVDEKTLHLNEYLNYGYWIGRFPVSNAQFIEFIRSDGYANHHYWEVAKKAGEWKNGRVFNPAAGGYRDQDEARRGLVFETDFSRDRPYSYGKPYNLPNHPIVGINWYEALAFTRWLTVRWRNNRWLSNGLSATLPSEAEWEKVARGGLELPTDPIIVPVAKGMSKAPHKVTLQPNPLPDRSYPWGNTVPDLERTIFRKTGVESTCGLGCFPKGRSPYGCQELSGNIWEWTRSIYGRWDTEDDRIRDSFKYPYEPSDGREDLSKHILWLRTLRGGTFNSDERQLRCAVRMRNEPHQFGNYSGFRVAICPYTGL